MTKTRLQKSVEHIEKIHSTLFPLSDLKWYRANKKSLMRNYENEIKKLQKEITERKKEKKMYYAQFKAYDRVVKQIEKRKTEESNGCREAQK